MQPCYGQDKIVSNDSKRAWYKIGDLRINFKADKDELKFTKTNTSTCKAILLRFTNAPVSVGDMQVHYENGSIEEIPISADYGAATETGIIHLKNCDAPISKLVLYCRSIPGAETDETQIELWGLNDAALVTR